MTMLYEDPNTAEADEPLKMTIIKADTSIEETVIDLGDQPREPGYEQIRKWLADHLPENFFPSGNFQRVAVYVTPDRKPTHGIQLGTKGVAADMFVDEMGAYSLDINPRATAIHQCAAMSRGERASDLNNIYGDAVLFSRRIWY